MAGTDKPQSIMTNDRQEIFEKVDHFAHGQGPILNREDQNIALGSINGDTTGFTSNEKLLEQLRSDAKRYVDVDAPNRLKGLESPRLYNDREMAVDEILMHDMGISSEFEKVKNYTPEQLKDIRDLVDAGHDHKKLKQVMQRFTNAEEFTELETGLQLELERRGRDPLDIGAAFYSNEKGQRVPTLQMAGDHGRVLTFTGKPEGSSD